MLNPQPAPAPKPTSLIVKNYSTSLTTSKLQTPIKSPSPDHLCSSVLTPTKVRYIGESSNVKGFQMYHSQLRPHSYQSGVEEIDDRRRQGRERRGKDLDNEYMKHLQQQVKILLIQNRNLLQKLTITEHKSQSSLADQHAQSAPQRSQSNLSGQSQAISIQPKRSTTLIIQKIKQQYQQKLSTLKLMIEQQIKQAMSVVEDMCQLMKNKLLAIESRVEGAESKVSEIKVEKIKQMQHMFNATMNKIGEFSRYAHSHSPQHQRSRDNPYNIYNVQNSISDILCVSIPEESEQQSKNQTITISNLQEEIQGLKLTINQTQEAYQKQKSYLATIIEQKNKELKILTNKLQEIQRKNHTMEWKFNSNSFNNINIREELKLLQKSVCEIGEELIQSQREHEQLLGLLEGKNMECESMSQEISMLHVKIIDSEKQRILLEEKSKFLESNISILEHELKETKKLLSKQINQRTSTQKQRIKNILGETHKKTSQKNVLTLTSRIDRLLLLEQERFRQNERNLKQFEQNIHGESLEKVEPMSEPKSYREEQDETRLENKDE